MKERPIIFSAPTVRAILEGRKTQTRRPILQPLEIGEDDTGKPWPVYPSYVNCGHNEGELADSPYGFLGDRLWVRERFRHYGNGWISGARRVAFVLYCADNSDRTIQVDDPPRRKDWTKDQPSILMPRWASRITLEITNVRVQRVQEVSFQDILAEGILEWVHEIGRDNMRQFRQPDPLADSDTKTWPESIDEAADDLEIEMRYCFSCLWDSINHKHGLGWDTNPWVWALTFRRIA